LVFASVGGGRRGARERREVRGRAFLEMMRCPEVEVSGPEVEVSVSVSVSIRVSIRGSALRIGHHDPDGVRFVARARGG
jgi:hypothetical protein